MYINLIFFIINDLLIYLNIVSPIITVIKYLKCDYFFVNLKRVGTKDHTYHLLCLIKL